MKPAKWNALKAAGIGALAGALLSLFSAMTSPEYQGAPLAFLAGMIGGGVVGGAILAAAVATVRNLFVK